MFLTSEHLVVDVLTQEECLENVSIIDSLSKEWTRRDVGVHHYYTFGVAAHLDIEPFDSVSDETFNLIKHKNIILRNNLSDLYEKVVGVISNELGKAELVSDEGPIPGFYIHGEAKPNNIIRESLPAMGGKTKIHKDGHFKALDHIWSKYKEAGSDIIGFTLPIEVPEAGAAFLLWDQPDLGYHNNKAMSDIYSSYDYKENPDNINILNNFIVDPVPKTIEHIPGRMVIQKGNQWHATGFSTAPLTTDRRITLQGFGIQCDGVWRLFF